MRTTMIVLSLLMASAAVFAHDSPEALMDRFMDALRAEDAEGLAACYADDAVNFPISGAMKEIGPDAVKASWDGFFSAFRVIDARLPEKHIETHGDTAIAWGLFRIEAEPVEGGEPVVIKGRFMDVSRKIDGTWMYVADHASVPAPQ